MSKAPASHAGNGAATPAPPPILDPGNQPASKYATAPRFAAGGAVASHVPVVFGKPKTFCRAFPSLAVNITLVDLARANEAGKKLYIIAPEAIADGALNRLPEAFEAWAVPLIDRDGVAFLWTVRQFTRDGVQLDSYSAAQQVIAKAEEEWTKFYWLSGGYAILPAPRQDLMGTAEIPSCLATIDDWIEAARPGAIIRTGDAAELSRLRGDA